MGVGRSFREPARRLSTGQEIRQWPTLVFEFRGDIGKRVPRQ